MAQLLLLRVITPSGVVVAQRGNKLPHFAASAQVDGQGKTLQRQGPKTKSARSTTVAEPSPPWPVSPPAAAPAPASRRPARPRFRLGRRRPAPPSARLPGPDFSGRAPPFGPLPPRRADTKDVTTD